jgi:hypothetical protein
VVEMGGVSLTVFLRSCCLCSCPAAGRVVCLAGFRACGFGGCVPPCAQARLTALLLTCRWLYGHSCAVALRLVFSLHLGTAMAGQLPLCELLHTCVLGRQCVSPEGSPAVCGHHAHTRGVSHPGWQLEQGGHGGVWDCQGWAAAAAAGLQQHWPCSQFTAKFVPLELVVRTHAQQRPCTMCTCWAAPACNMPWVMVHVQCVCRGQLAGCVFVCAAQYSSTGPPGAQCTICLCPAVHVLLPGGSRVTGTRASAPAVRHCQLKSNGSSSISAPCNCLNHSWRGLCNPHTLLHAAHVLARAEGLEWAALHPTQGLEQLQVEVWP